MEIHRGKANGKFKVEETDVEARPPPSSQLHAPGCLAFYPRFDASLWLNEQFYSLLPVLLSVLGDWEWVGGVGRGDGLSVSIEAKWLNEVKIDKNDALAKRMQHKEPRQRLVISA